MRYKRFPCNLARVLSTAAVLFVTASVIFCSGCSKNISDNQKNQSEKSDSENQNNTTPIQDGEHTFPKGEITEIWFDEVFRAFYPKQLKNIFFTKTYLYGEFETDQPAICLCSEKITDISLFAITNGEAGDTLYTVEALEPMESIMIQEDFFEEPHIGIRFKSSDGTEYSYSISRNSDDSEIVLKSF